MDGDENTDSSSEPPASKVSIYGELEKRGADPNEIKKIVRTYPMKVTRYFLNLSRLKDDPIWRQCVPDIKELEDDFNIDDPLMEEDHTPVPFLVHKYPDRVLLLTSSKCAMYCRFCTRKRKVGRIQQIPMDDIFRAIRYIEENPVVRDVVVSGGDPLMRTDAELEMILQRLSRIPHVEIIRIGTRMPCVQPSRVTKRLVNMLARYHPLYMNIHFNHPCEITDETRAACKMLVNAGIVLGSQTVLLKGVNDSAEIMKELMHRLLSMRVRPYYIYQCDLVKGVEHFRTPVETGIEIMRQIQGFTSGLALPHFVIDGPGGKIPVSPQYIREITAAGTTVSNYLDTTFRYPGLRDGSQVSMVNTSVRRIGIAYNLRKEPVKGERFDRYAEYDDMETIDAITKALEGAGYEVVLLEVDLDFPEKVRKASVDFVFNIAEGIQGESRESHVPAILEMLRIPYSGSGILTQAITLNKSRKKEILTYHGIPTPKFQLCSSAQQKLKPDMRFPLIVKPDAEGSSVGIINDSYVTDTESLKRQIRRITKEYAQLALVEEYVPGREFTISLLGNRKPTILPIVEVNFDHLPKGLHHFDSFEAKWTYDTPTNPIDPLVCPAIIKDPLRTKLKRLARRTFEVLGCTDLCRIDFRLDEKGTPHVLDVNALPGLMPDPRSNSRFTRSCYSAGMGYNDMILNILNTALRRYNLKM